MRRARGTGGRFLNTKKNEDGAPSEKAEPNKGNKIASLWEKQVSVGVFPFLMNSFVYPKGEQNSGYRRIPPDLQLLQKETWSSGSKPRTVASVHRHSLLRVDSCSRIVLPSFKWSSSCKVIICTFLWMIYAPIVDPGRVIIWMYWVHHSANVTGRSAVFRQFILGFLSHPLLLQVKLAVLVSVSVRRLCKIRLN